MTLQLYPASLRGQVLMQPSKSQLHRLLICAALADTNTHILCAETKAEDILATCDCLRALGAQITRVQDGYQVSPLQREALPKTCVLPCRESGSTLRFLLPVVCALGLDAEFLLAGRLPERPLFPLDRELERQGCRLRLVGKSLFCSGQLRHGDFCLPGDVSSQYITGLLLALPLLKGNSSLTLTGKIESADYIELTRTALDAFGLRLPTAARTYTLRGNTRLRSPQRICAEGDWSNAAFWLCAGTLQGGDILLQGLTQESLQGDRAIVAILQRMGAEIHWEGEGLRCRASSLRGTDIDAAPIPDLIPVLAAVSALAKGETKIVNAARLRLKESDRLKSTASVLSALGAQLCEGEDRLHLSGRASLSGGAADAWGDHRIAMTAAVAALGCTAPVTLTGAEAVAKSYPDFWELYRGLGGQTKEVLP